jgi:secreted PhoX family phosphatase
MLASKITPAPIGTLNNCAHGVTPWNTYLTCEENWNGYFGTADPAWSRTPLETRYGVTAAGFGYNWHVAEPRFDLAQNRNELNHFGWVVEFDPFDPTSQPVKRTALGRIKHEGAVCTESRGRVVVYSGDDENGDYVYKFVGDRPWRQARAKGLSPLDHGTLYVARFHEDGRGEWLPLVHGRGPLTSANGWLDQADVLIRTRMAADAVGATRLHRPEWASVHPTTGEVFLTLTNGTGNAAAVNSGRDPNPYGHIIRWREAANDDTSFEWDIFLLAGDVAYDPVVPVTQSVFGSPDGIWVDSRGIIWIQTDISNSSQNRRIADTTTSATTRCSRRSRRRGGAALPHRSARVRDHGRDHDTRRAHHVHQRPASRRVHDVLEQPVRRTERGQSANGEQLALRRSTAIGDSGHSQARRRQDRLLMSHASGVSAGRHRPAADRPQWRPVVATATASHAPHQRATSNGNEGRRRSHGRRRA